MAAIHITFQRTEAVGGHVHIGLTVNGGPLYTAPMHVDELSTLPTQEEIEAYIRCTMRLHKIGRTIAQVRQNVTAGLDITV